MADNKNNFKAFLNDPGIVAKSPKFTLVASAFNFILLVIFASFAASIGFKFSAWQDLLDWGYWLSVAILTAEQFYAHDAIGYVIGMTIMKSADTQLEENNKQINELVNGIDHPKDSTQSFIGLKFSVEEAQIAIDEMNKEEKLRLGKKLINKTIQFFKNKKANLESKKHKHVLFPFRIKASKHYKHWFKNRAKAIAWLDKQIEDGENLLKEDVNILDMSDRMIPGYVPCTYADIMSGQDENKETDESRYAQRSEAKAKNKSKLKRGIKKVFMSLAGPAILWGAFGWNGALLAIFFLVVQVVNGARFAGKIEKNVVLYNSTTRLAALVEIKHRRERIKKEIELKEQARKLFVEESAKKAANLLMAPIASNKPNEQNYTFDINQPINAS